MDTNIFYYLTIPVLNIILFSFTLAAKYILHMYIIHVYLKKMYATSFRQLYNNNIYLGNVVQYFLYQGLILFNAMVLNFILNFSNGK